MALNAQGYFNCLKSYLHHDDYGVQQPISGAVVLKEKIHKTQGERPKEFKVTLTAEGQVIVIKLDGKKTGFSISWMTPQSLGQSAATL